MPDDKPLTINENEEQPMMMIESYMTCDHEECDSEVTAVHAADFPIADARVAVATCAAAVGWQVGEPYDQDDSFDLCPEHRRA